jgi:hypothetical protein
VTVTELPVADTRRKRADAAGRSVQLCDLIVWALTALKPMDAVPPVACFGNFSLHQCGLLFVA